MVSVLQLSTISSNQIINFADKDKISEAASHKTTLHAAKTESFKMNPTSGILLGAAGGFWFLFLIQAIYFCGKIRSYRRRIDEGYYFTEKIMFGQNGQSMVTLAAIHPNNVDLSGEIPRVINPALTYD